MNLGLIVKVGAIAFLQIMGFGFAMGTGRSGLEAEQGKKGARGGSLFCAFVSFICHVVATLLAMSI